MPRLPTDRPEFKEARAYLEVDDWDEAKAMASFRSHEAFERGKVTGEIPLQRLHRSSSSTSTATVVASKEAAAAAAAVAQDIVVAVVVSENDVAAGDRSKAAVAPAP